MGQLVYIKTKDDANLDRLNASLEKLELPNLFLTEKHIKDWLEDVNNPDSEHYIKRKDGEKVDYSYLKSYFGNWITTIGQLSFDVAYGRTSQEEAKNYAKFIVKNIASIEYIKGGAELISRYVLTPKQKEVIALLEKPSNEPKKLPIHEQHHPDLQSGLFLCKSFSPSPFWVVFGKVDAPTFLKTRIYEDDLMNNIYRDKKGYAYLLLPLLPLGSNTSEFICSVYERAYGMGLREAFGLITSFIYGVEFNNLKDMVEDLKNFYDEDELKERFKSILTMSISSYGYNQDGGIVWRTNEFVPCGQNYGLIRSRCQLLTGLYHSLPESIAEDIISTCVAS
jgi:hypothetical protein